MISTGALVELPLTNSVFFSAMLILVGMLFDMLDGQVARGLKQTSPFGAQLDSLCDAITFGAAPVFVLLAFSDVFRPPVLFAIGIVYSACVLLRLARFNVETAEAESQEFFSGLPSPAAAGTIASFALALPGLERWIDPSKSASIQQMGTTLIAFIMVALPPFTLLLSALMLSRVSYRRVISRCVERRYRIYQLFRSGLIILAALIVHELAVPLAFCIFALEPLYGATRRKLQSYTTRLRADRDHSVHPDDRVRIDIQSDDFTS